MDTIITLGTSILIIGALLFVVFLLKKALQSVLEDYKETKNKLIESVLQILNRAILPSPSPIPIPCPEFKLTEENMTTIITIILKNNFNYPHTEAENIGIS